jgi:hypothetical protein
MSPRKAAKQDGNKQTIDKQSINKNNNPIDDIITDIENKDIFKYDWKQKKTFFRKWNAGSTWHYMYMGHYFSISLNLKIHRDHLYM